MKMSRTWAMPNSETFTIAPISDFVKRWWCRDGITVDPFARNNEAATYTNDLNPDTKAQYHMDAEDFIKQLIKENVIADLVLFDPPYSPRQMKEMYNDIGLALSQKRTQGWKGLRDAINQIIPINGVVLSFGWNSNGMGKGKGYEIEEILLVAHGKEHNDTICLAERKIIHQNELLL